MIRILIALVVALSAIWSGYWLYGSRVHRDMIVGVLEQARGNGWDISYSEVDLKGFPNRFDTTISDLRIAHPLGTYLWEGEALRLATLSYRPDHIIAVFPERHRLELEGAAYSVRSSDMRASVEFGGSSETALQQLILEAADLEVGGPGGWSASAGMALAAIRASDAEPALTDLALRIGNARLSSGTGALQAMGIEGLESASAEAVLKLSRPLGPAMCLDGIARATGLEGIRISAAWGVARLDASGSLEFDMLGRPSGGLDISVGNWRELLAAAAESGAIPPGHAQSLEFALGLLAMLSADPDTLDARVEFSDGVAELAGVALFETSRMPPLCANA